MVTRFVGDRGGSLAKRLAGAQAHEVPGMKKGDLKSPFIDCDGGQSNTPKVM